MRTDQTKTVAALVTIAGAVALLYFSLREPLPSVDPRPERALGQVLAEEAAKVLGSGGRLTLITHASSTLDNPTAALQLEGFFQALKKSNLKLAATNIFQQDPLRLIRVPPAAFVEIMRKQAEGDVIVSFLGPPVLNEEQKARLGEKGPRVVAVCSGWLPRQIDLKELFAQNLLHVAIVSRLIPAPIPSASGNLQNWFDHLYQVITPANLAELPVPSNSVGRSPLNLNK
jgi:hypothetical protein